MTHAKFRVPVHRRYCHYMPVFRNLGLFQNLLSSILNVSSPQNGILVYFCFNNFNLVLALEIRRAVPSSILRSSFMYAKKKINPCCPFLSNLVYMVCLFWSISRASSLCILLFSEFGFYFKSSSLFFNNNYLILVP